MNKIKKISAVIMTVAVLITVLSCFTASADTYIVLDDYKFKYNSDGDVVIADYYGTDTTMRIPDTILDRPVVSIEPNAFSDNTTIEYVEFGANMKILSSFCFSNSALKEVTLPSSLEQVVMCAFQNCKQLEKVTIEDGSLTTITRNTFYGCTSLSSVDLGASVTAIEKYAFGNCPNLQKIYIPNSVTSIDSTAFYSDSVTIYGYSDSNAIQFATDNGVDNVIIDRQERAELKTAMDNAKALLDNSFKYIPDTISGLSDEYNSAMAVYEDIYADNAQLSDAVSSLNMLMEQAVEYIIGDADLNGELSVLDATRIQLYCAKAFTMDDTAEYVSDVDKDGTVSINDVTRLQMILAKLI